MPDRKKITGRLVYFISIHARVRQHELLFLKMLWIFVWSFLFPKILKNQNYEFHHE